ncbi:MAG: ATP-binding protein [Deltaproteobacteria bacterium]|nr:ATP-binding protein [Deltaproteobacteria bacterium]
MHWWEHYGYRSQPFLDANQPLTTSDDLALFWGRAKELRSLKMSTDTETKTCLLIVGDAGVGKSTLQYKAFEREAGFIRVDLAKVSGRTPDREIARSCVQRLKELRTKAADLDKKLRSRSTSRTTGRTLKAAPGGTGISSVKQTTETLDRDLELEEITKTACERVSSKCKRILLALDESDFLGDGTPTELSKLCNRMMALVSRPAVIILTHRDADHQFELDFKDTTSLVRSTFDGILQLSSLWKPGEGDVKALLQPRFQRGRPSKATKFPLSDEACYWLDALSHGNVREVLRYTRHVLMRAVGEQKPPLPANYVLNRLLSDFPELDIDEEEELAVLAYLKKRPSSVSDKSFQGVAGSRSSLQRRLESLEKRWLVERDAKGRGKRQTYKITQKAEILLEWRP